MYILLDNIIVIGGNDGLNILDTAELYSFKESQNMLFPYDEQ